MPSDKGHNVFISHVHADDHHVGKFRDLMKRNGYRVKDSSIDSTNFNNASNAEYIKREHLAPRIRWAGKVIVLIGPTTSQSDWVGWEIRKAHREGKRIVGIYLWGAKGSDVPQDLIKYGHATVGWSSKRIVDALEGRYNCWCEPVGDGEFEERDRHWVVARHNC